MAFFKGSPYEDVPAFAPAEDGALPFKGIRARPLPIPETVLDHSVALGDRLDTVAQNYYAEPRDWRRLAEANPDRFFLEDALYDVEAEDLQLPKLGQTLGVPRRRDGGLR